MTLREQLKELYRESRRIIYAHARNESMSVAERRENVEIEEHHFVDQIITLLKSHRKDGKGLAYVPKFFKFSEEALDKIDDLCKTWTLRHSYRDNTITNKINIELLSQIEEME